MENMQNSLMFRQSGKENVPAAKRPPPYPPPQAGRVVRGGRQGRAVEMRALKIGNVTITSIVERDGPWRRPEDMFPAYDPDAGRRHLAELDPEVFDPVSGRLVITYRTYVVR